MFKNKTIFKKLFLSSLLILFLSFLFFLLVFNYLIHNIIFKSYQDTLIERSEQIARYLDEADEQRWDNHIIQSTLDLSLNHEDHVTFIYDDTGKLKYYPQNAYVDHHHIDHKVVQSVIRGEEIMKLTKVNGSNMLIVAGPMSIPSEAQLEHVIVTVIHGFDKNASELRLINLLAILITITLTAIIIFFVSRKISSPLQEMNNIVLKFAKGDFSENVKVRSKDEIGQLGESVNHMAKELSSIEQMRRDFVANVSHDLRSPLTSINGFLVAILDGTIPDERRNHYLAIMKNETERLIKLVNDLLDISKLESNELQIDPTSYNFSEQLRLIIAKMEPVLLKHETEIELNDEDEDIYVYADSERIEQVLINLIQNAIHFSPNKSIVNIKLECDKNKVMFVVRDKGNGISEQDLQYIWDRFYKADKSRTNKLGAGIGLSIVKRIIDLHDTTITVESNLGEGTTFSFALPLARN